MAEVSLGVRGWTKRFDDDVAMTAARSAKRFRFFFGFPVAEELRMILGKFTGCELVEQIVFDASARQRPDEVALCVTGEQGADGAWRRSVGCDDGR